MPLTPSPSPSPDLNNNNSSGWDPQVIGLVGLIFSLFLLFSYYKILARNNYCASFHVIAMSRNQEQRRRINEHLEEISSQLQSRGLDSYIMNSLPIKQFKKNNYKAEDYQCMECAVCLGKFEEGEWMKHLPRCSHTYHVSCIDTWFQTHSSCPLCRSIVDEVSMPNECSLSIVLEGLDREDFHRGRSEQYQVLGSPNWIVSAEHDN